MDWPAHVKLKPPNPPGDPPRYYPNGATVEIKIDPHETFGKNLELSWQIFPYSAATYTILDNTCATGTLQNSRATTCKLQINRGSSGAFQSEGTPKLAALEPVPGVEVIVTGEHTLKDHDNIEVHFIASDYVDMYFKTGGDHEVETVFSDVPPDHPDAEFIQYLYDHGFVSGCTTVGEPAFCTDDPITREQHAVIMVRAEHQEEPGYVPDKEKPVVVPFIDVQEKMAVEAVDDSTTPTQDYWAGPWIAELYDLGLTAGCSENPPRYCPEESVTRAQMAVFAVKLFRGQGFEPTDPVTPPFNDVSLYDADGNVSWIARWTAQAKADNLIQNCGTDMVAMIFRPNEPSTRAEMACMVYHALTNEANDIVPPN
jgi:hypothetical protein